MILSFEMLFEALCVFDEFVFDFGPAEITEAWKVQVYVSVKLAGEVNSLSYVLLGLWLSF